MEGEKETLNSHRNSLSSTWPQLSPQMTAPQKWCLVLDIRPPTKSSPIKRRLFHALVQHDGEVCRTYSTIVVCRRYLLLLERVRTAARGSLASQNYVFEPIRTYPTPNSSSNLTLHPFIFLRYLFFFFSQWRLNEQIEISAVEWQSPQLPMTKARSASVGILRSSCPRAQHPFDAEFLIKRYSIELSFRTLCRMRGGSCINTLMYKDPDWKRWALTWWLFVWTEFELRTGNGRRKKKISICVFSR